MSQSVPNCLTVSPQVEDDTAMVLCGFPDTYSHSNTFGCQWFIVEVADFVRVFKKSVVVCLLFGLNLLYI